MNETVDKILNGKITVKQMKCGFRYGFDTVYLAAYVNTFLKKYKKNNILLADVGSGVGTISLIIAYRNIDAKIVGIENNEKYNMLCKENILINNFQNQIEIVDNDIFTVNKNLINNFDVVVSNLPFFTNYNNRSKYELNDYAKRIVDLEKWIDNSVKLLKDKGYIFLIIPTEIIYKVLFNLSKKTGSFKIFPFWPNNKKSSKRVILSAKKGGGSPIELMRGLKLFNNDAKLTKRAKAISEEGFFKFL